jgi:hypothetical protein
VTDVVLNVNNDKYKVVPEKKVYDFVYLNRKNEIIMVDFAINDARGRSMYFKKQPIDSLPYDINTKQRVVDKKFIRKLVLEGKMARM